MKIKSVYLQDFKRFTDLKITDLPETAKLVVLIGPNGCGKSSVFDALHGKAVVQYYFGWQREQSGYWNKQYSLEDKKRSENFNPSQRIEIDFHGVSPTNRESWKRAIYVRSAYRNDPTVLVQQLQRVCAAVDEHRFARLIENDAAVLLNYQRLVSDGLEEIFEDCNTNTTLDDFRKRLIGDIQDAIHRLFDSPPLDLNSLGSPLRDGTFRFNKGRARQFSYENLSGGEKAAFDLILDLVVKRGEYNDTVFCIDEPEAHLSLRLQSKLLSELYRLIPKNCQLWISTHSIGMMRAAYDLEQKNPDTVVFLDFDKRDFDQSEVVRPSTINRTVWENMHHIVLEDLAALIAPRKIILCEGKHGEEGLDAKCYNTIFAEKHPDTLFVSTGGKGEGSSYSAVIKAIVKAEVILLRDKDNLSPQELKQEKDSGKLVLSRKNIEEYLLDDDILCALCERHAPTDENKVRELLQLKQEKLKDKKGDIKAVVNDLRKWTIDILKVDNAGDKYGFFLRDTIAPLFKSGTKIYKELEKDIFGDES